MPMFELVGTGKYRAATASSLAMPSPEALVDSLLSRSW